jgi:hypothetical protein
MFINFISDSLVMKSYVVVFFIAFIILAGCNGSDGCPQKYEPVCGEDGKTYTHPCLANKSGVPVDHEGRCKPPPPACDDSDGGKDIFTAGNVTENGRIFEDKCKDDDTVLEFICDNDKSFTEELPCPDSYICDDGMCVESPCDDSDGGVKPQEEGTVTSGQDTWTDMCEQNGSLKEYYCDDTEMASKYVECQEDEFCDGGACVGYGCTDSDGGKDEDEQGTTTYIDESEEDECFDSNTVLEYYCSGTTIKSEKIDCEKGYLCKDGECIEGPKCMDSDDGKDKFTKGTVTVEDDEYDDNCYSNSAVLEYFCSGDNVKTEKLTCGSDHECSNGKCVVIECTKDEEAFDEEDVRYKIEDYGSSDKLTLYLDEAVEINEEMILELSSIATGEATFSLYLDYDDYRTGDEECIDAINENDTLTDMCGESTGDIEVDLVDAGDDFAEIFLDEYTVTEYYSGEGQDTEYFGYACTDDDEKIYTELNAYFLPHLDTASSGLDLEGKKFKFFGQLADIEDVDDSARTFSFDLDGDSFELEDGEGFAFHGRDYEVDLYFNDGGLYRLLVQID